jgi:hypothetical protein
LQALTRVNRPYKNFRYGFVVDFADIRKEFDAINSEIGGWKPHLHKQNLPSQVKDLNLILVRAGGLCLYSREFYSPGLYNH